MFDGKSAALARCIFIVGFCAIVLSPLGCSLSASSVSVQDDPAAVDVPAGVIAGDGPEAGPAPETALDEEEGKDDAVTVENGSTAPPLTESEKAVQGLLDAALELTESAQEYWSQGEPEKAMEDLDSAYLLITKVTPEAGERFMQQKEDLRFLISKRITEIHASRITRVNGLHGEIPLVMNEHVEREIRQFQTVERDFFLESYARSGIYRDAMVRAFQAAGMPEEIAWLPLIESGFKVRALSRARALGLWQFIPSTGYKFGLKRNEWVDERLNPEKSTQAAIAFLRELHQIFGDWATALAAYNCGEGNVLRVIRGQKVSYLDNFWDLYQRLPRETARYYPRFQAVMHILRDPAKYGFELPDRLKPLRAETVPIEKQVHLKTVAERLGITQDELELLNPELRREATPPTTYTLRVPEGKGEVLLASIDSIPVYKPPKPTYAYHRVRYGETLSTIAQRYRTSVGRIMDTNNLRSARFIRAGQRLKIPLRSTTS